MKYVTPINLQYTDGDSFSIDKFTFCLMDNSLKGLLLGFEEIVHDKVTTMSKPNHNAISYLEKLFPSHLLPYYQGCEYLIECDNSEKENISILLLALRIYKYGALYAPLTLEREQPFEHSIWFNYPLFTQENIVYTLTKNDIEDITNLYQNLLKLKTDKKLNSIFKRFGNAISRDADMGNSFVDLVGIIEALVVRNNENELSFKFSLFTFYLLKKYYNLIITFKEIQEFYNIRSAFAHSGYYDKKNISEQQELLAKLDDLTRKIILLYINKPELSKENVVRDAILNQLEVSIKSQDK